eukprot:scaffold10501_cov141-Amphora_coffeaeformis.AAC.6
MYTLQCVDFVLEQTNDYVGEQSIDLPGLIATTQLGAREIETEEATLSLRKFLSPTRWISSATEAAPLSLSSPKPWNKGNLIEATGEEAMKSPRKNLGGCKVSSGARRSPSLVTLAIYDEDIVLVAVFENSDRICIKKIGFDLFSKLHVSNVETASSLAEFIRAASSENNTLEPLHAVFTEKGRAFYLDNVGQALHWSGTSESAQVHYVNFDKIAWVIENSSTSLVVLNEPEQGRVCFFSPTKASETAAPGQLISLGAASGATFDTSTSRVLTLGAKDWDDDEFCGESVPGRLPTPLRLLPRRST